eukprot:2275409-Prymnesium_polylepis.1
MEISSAGGCYQTPAKLLPASIFRIDQKRVEAELEVELLLRRDWGLLEPQTVEAWWAGFDHPLRDSIPTLDITSGIAAAGLNSSVLMLNGVSPDEACFSMNGLNSLGQLAGYLAEQATAGVSIGLQYRWAMYWTTSLVLGGTQLYEEESPLFFPAIAIFFTICGLLMLAFILHTILKLMQDSHEAILYRSRLQGVRGFLKGRAIPRELRTKVVDYFEYCTPAGIEPTISCPPGRYLLSARCNRSVLGQISQSADWKTVGASGQEQEVLAGLPFALQLDLTMSANRRLLSEIPLFKRLSTHKGPRSHLVCFILQQMRPMISQPDDLIASAGNRSSGLYVIISGLCSEHDPTADESSSSVFRLLFPGDFFGDELLTDGVIARHVRARAPTQMM